MTRRRRFYGTVSFSVAVTILLITGMQLAPHLEDGRSLALPIISLLLIAYWGFLFPVLRKGGLQNNDIRRLTSLPPQSYEQRQIAKETNVRERSRGPDVPDAIRFRVLPSRFIHGELDSQLSPVDDFVSVLSNCE